MQAYRESAHVNMLVVRGYWPRWYGELGRTSLSTKYFDDVLQRGVERGLQGWGVTEAWQLSSMPAAAAAAAVPGLIKGVEDAMTACFRERLAASLFSSFTLCVHITLHVTSDVFKATEMKWTGIWHILLFSAFHLILFHFILVQFNTTCKHSITAGCQLCNVSRSWS